MKKIVLPIIIFLLTFTTGVANTSDDIIESEVYANSVVLTNVNSFCKLIQMGDYNAVKALIENGENVNRKSTGLTPLMFAARHNKAKIAKLLIANGAKLYAKSDRGGFTALRIAELSKAKDAYWVIHQAIKNKKKR